LTGAVAGSSGAVAPAVGLSLIALPSRRKRR
jgi:hypothetical protein